MMKNIRNMSKTEAFQTVVKNMNELCYKQTMDHRLSLIRIASLVGLGELILVLIIIVLSASGWWIYGTIIASLIMGSLITNMIWFILLRREIRICM
jgi:hypothetical protein